MSNQESILTKQQLFVNPISILQKEKSKNPLQTTQIQQPNVQTNPSTDVQNFSSFIITTLDPQNPTQTNKTKQISKASITLSSSVSAQQNRHKNYRTRMCPQGRQCRKRLVCQFAHSEYQLRRPYKNRKNPCLRYQKGLCSLGAACPDYHGNMDLKKKNYKYKTQKCEEWEKKGTCAKGKLCIFLHGEDGGEGSEVDSGMGSVQNGENAIHVEKQYNDQINCQQDNFQKEQQQVQNLQAKKEVDNQDNNQKRPKIGDIFKTENKRQVIVKEVVQQKIQQKQQPIQQSNVQQENFNIEFNF